MSNKKRVAKSGTVAGVFSNNKIVMVISFVLAVIIWITYSIVVAPERSDTIRNVPITINFNGSIPESNGLKAYGYENITVDVEIFGNSHAVGAADRDDVIVSVQNLNQVEDAGYYDFQLTARSVDGDFAIESINPSMLSVYFDFPETKRIEVIHEIDEPAGGIAADGCYYNGAFYGATELVISGPKTEVQKITHAVARLDLSEQLTTTETKYATLELVTADGSSSPKYISYDDSQVREVTLSIQKSKNLKTHVDFINAPLDYSEGKSLKVSYSKEEILVAGTSSQISNTQFELGVIDFRQLSPGINTFEFEVKAPSGTTVVDGTEKVTVTVDMSGFAMSSFYLNESNITVKNGPSNYSIDFNGIVQIVSTQKGISSITDAHIVAEVDLSGVALKPGANKVELNIGARNRGDCWAYGTYTATITVY